MGLLPTERWPTPNNTCQHGLNTEAFHTRMQTEKKTDLQDKFTADDNIIRLLTTPIQIVATIAFDVDSARMRGTRTTESSTSQRCPKRDYSAVTACGISKTDEIPAEISPTAFGVDMGIDI